MSLPAATTALRTASSASSALAPSTLKVITAASLRPTYLNGRWRKPAVSAMQLARVRKATLLAGQPWTLSERTNRRKEKPVKFKGHKAERVAQAKSGAQAHAAAAAAVIGHRHARSTLILLCCSAVLRALKIEQAMRDMPKRVEEYYRVPPTHLPTDLVHCSADSAPRLTFLLSPPRRVPFHCAQVQRSLRVHDTLFTRIMGFADAGDGKGKKAKPSTPVPNT